MAGALIPVSQIRNRHRGTMRIGNTLFVDGVPHIACGNPECEQPIRLHDSYRITIGWWKELEDTILDKNGCVESIETKWKPMLRQVNGCFTCWQAQQAQRDNGRWLWSIGELKKEPLIFIKVRPGTGGGYSAGVPQREKPIERYSRQVQRQNERATDRVERIL